MFDRDYDAAYTIIRHMMTMPIPTKLYSFLNIAWYTWKGTTLYGNVLRALKRYEEADKHELETFQKHQGTISLIHASRGRPEQAIAQREIWLGHAANPNRIEHIFAVDKDDEASCNKIGFYNHVVVEPGGGCVRAWNEGAKLAHGAVLIQVSDDFTPPQNWDDLILEKLGDLADEKVLAVSDDIRSDGLLCMAIMTRARYEKQGYMFHPDFLSMYSDNWFTEEAYRDGVVIEAKDIVFHHNHPAAFKEVPVDQTYADTNSPERYKQGEEVLHRLRAARS
jgi:hypothetical protein